MSANFFMTEDSIFNFINFERPSTKAERNSLTSSFNFAILYTFLSALCELAIMITARNDKKSINLQFLNESSLIKIFPLKMLFILFFMLLCLFETFFQREKLIFAFYVYIFSAILNFALLALLFIFISSCVGIINFPIFFNGTVKFPNISFSGSPSNIPFLIKRFTNLSSNE